MHNIKVYDNYRGILSIVVFIGHLCAVFLFPYFGSDGSIAIVSNYLSTWSVNIFFLLSGYLIVYSILGNITKNGYFKWSDYLISRVARIYPPLLASIFLTMVLYWLVVYLNLHGKYTYRLPLDLYVIRENFSFEYREIIDSLLMKGGLLLVNGALWSLYIEVQIYIVAMLVAMLFKGNLNGWAKAVTLLVLFYLSVKLRNSLVFVLIWGIGCMFSIVNYKKIIVPKVIVAIFSLLMFVVFIYYIFMPEVFLQNENSVNGILATMGLSYLLAGLIFSLKLGGDFISLFSKVARYSYTLYIVHFPLLLFAFSLTHEYLSSNFQYLKLIIVCILVFCFILFLSSWMASFFEDKLRFEGYARKLLAFFEPKFKINA